mgnify:CR=1 FL=1
MIENINNDFRESLLPKQVMVALLSGSNIEKQIVISILKHNNNDDDDVVATINDFLDWANRTTD